MYARAVFVCAGKTLMLVLQGLRWLQEGHPVLVLNTFGRPWPHAEHTAHQLRTTLEKQKKGASNQEGTSSLEGLASPQVYIYQCNFVSGGEEEVTRAVDELTEFAKQHGYKLFILADEAFPE
jgi:hypothetical protein